MERSLLPLAARPCIWMSAGLIRYKLCERDFDCERCPLDAGLRGEREPGAGDGVPGERCGALIFPEDRRYSRGHCWLEGRRGAPARIGLDAFAAALAGQPKGVRWSRRGTLTEGDPLCALELVSGTLPLAAPAAGVVRCENPALAGRPELIAADPYGDGWLLEMDPRDGSLERLAGADEAREMTQLDLRHFRRRVALQLLADLEGVGPTMADGGEALTDLRRMLGAKPYLTLLREFVH